MSIERVGVIGAGQMGGGIAEVCAKAGAQVLVFEPTDDLISAGSKRITASLDRAIDVLLPAESAGQAIYSAAGSTLRPTGSGALQA